MGVTQELCRVITRTRYENLGAACIDRVKQAIKDGIAVGVAGSGEEAVRIVAAHVKSFRAKPQSTLWGHGFKSSPVFAAYVNGSATHVLDFEPMWNPPTHSVSPTVPVAFALAESHGFNGRQIVAAVAKGMEIQGRMQFAGNQYVPEQLLFHAPGVSGVMGGAVTAGHLLKLDEQRLRHALGIAGSRAGSLLANIGSMTKSTHCGQAGAAGLDAALLAQRGFTANPDIFEAHKGFISAFYPGGFDAAKLLSYGRPWRVLDPGLAIKMFPSQYATHFAITAGLELASQIPDKSRITRVTITGPVMNVIDRPEPVSGLAGKMSFQYTAAAAILDGAVGIDTFSDRRRFKPDMVALLRKTTLRQDPAMPNDLHKMRVEIVVETQDGTRHEAVCRGPKGTWGMPRLDPKDHRVKLEDCLGRALSANAVTHLLDRLDRLERLSATGVRETVRLIGQRRKRQPARRLSSRR